MGRPTELEMVTSEPSAATENRSSSIGQVAIVFDIRVLKRRFPKKTINLSEFRGHSSCFPNDFCCDVPLRLASDAAEQYVDCKNP